jgi:hypothetical protein
VRNRELCAISLLPCYPQTVTNFGFFFFGNKNTPGILYWLATGDRIKTLHCITFWAVIRTTALLLAAASLE